MTRPVSRDGRSAGDSEAAATPRGRRAADQQSAAQQPVDAGIFGGMAAAAPDGPGDFGRIGAWVVGDEGEDVGLFGGDSCVAHIDSMLYLSDPRQHFLRERFMP